MFAFRWNCFKFVSMNKKVVRKKRYFWRGLINKQTNKQTNKRTNKQTNNQTMFFIWLDVIYLTFSDEQLEFWIEYFNYLRMQKWQNKQTTKNFLLRLDQTKQVFDEQKFEWRKLSIVSAQFSICVRVALFSSFGRWKWSVPWGRKKLLINSISFDWISVTKL